MERSTIFKKGKSTINGPFSIAMLVYQRVNPSSKHPQIVDVPGKVNMQKTNWKDPPFSMGKSTINGPFSIAMLVITRG